MYPHFVLYGGDPPFYCLRAAPLLPGNEVDSSFIPLRDQNIVSLPTKLVKYLQSRGFSSKFLYQARALLIFISGVWCQKSVDILTPAMV